MRPIALAALAIAGCSSAPGNDAGPPPPKICFEGDRALQPEITPVVLNQDFQLEDVGENSRLPLIFPPQGGKVSLIGVRAKNIDGCPLNITTSLRDPCNNQLISREERQVTLTPMNGVLVPDVPTADNFHAVGAPEFSNLPACPRSGLMRDVHDQPYVLSIRVEDKTGLKAETTLRVTPFCAEPANLEQCTCECDTEFMQGVTICGTADSGIDPDQCRADAGM